MHNEEKPRFLPDVWVGPKPIQSIASPKVIRRHSDQSKLGIASPRGVRRHSDHFLPKIIGLDEIAERQEKEISQHPKCNKYTKIEQTLDRKKDNVDDGKNDHIISLNRHRNMFKEEERKKLRFGSLDRESKM